VAGLRSVSQLGGNAHVRLGVDHHREATADQLMVIDEDH
jgi:hypothetical protein